LRGSDNVVVGGDGCWVCSGSYNIVIKLTIPGRPVPKGRPRVVRGRAYTPAKTKQAEEKIAWCALEKGIKPYKTGYVKVVCEFYFKGKGHGDLDNLLKLVCDSGNGIFYKDDRQIIWLRGAIFLHQEEEKTEIFIDRH